LLDRGSLATPSSPGEAEPAGHELTNVIYLAGSIAGSYGIPLESDSVRERLNVLYSYACPDRWPEISRLLSELYAHSYAGYLSRLKTGFQLKRSWHPAEERLPLGIQASGSRTAGAEAGTPAARRSKRHSHPATRRS
jgi:hypothetical protein